MTGIPAPGGVWPEAAYDLVRANKDATGLEFRALIDQLVRETNHTRKACYRFARRLGVRWKRPCKPWSEKDQGRLRKQLEAHSVPEIAKKMQRSRSSVWHMIQRLGLSVQIGHDSFTKYTLARILHVRVERVETWISCGWLPAHEVEQGGVRRTIIEGEDFVDFCKAHTKEVVGNGLAAECLEFVCYYAFPPSHEELLAVRASKKERAAYAAQVEAQGQRKKPTISNEEPDRDG